jgi:hypothetical protein
LSIGVHVGVNVLFVYMCLCDGLASCPECTLPHAL